MRNFDRAPRGPHWRGFPGLLAATVATCLAACVSPGHAAGPQVAAGAMREQPGPPVVARAMEEQRGQLLAQCPAAPARVPESDEVNFPIQVDHWGGAGSKVLLIHGGIQGRVGGGPRTFDRQRALASMGWSVERLSRPGFGDSPSRGPDDMQADARAFDAFITPGVHVIAHSWGGTEALLAVARHPERVRSLVLVEPAVMPTIGGPAVLQDPAVAADLRSRIQAQLSARTPGDYASVFFTQMGEVAKDDRLGPVMTPALATEFGCAALHAKMASNEEVLVAISAVRQAHVPVLIVTGGWSPSIDAMGEVVAGLLGGRHIVVRSPNHFVQYTSAAEFNQVVSDFMRDVEARHQGR